MLAWGLLPCRTLCVFADKGQLAGHRPAAPTAQARPGDPSERLIISRDTEIRLDGCLCSYEQVPASAVITFAEVDSDRQTVLRIYYRSPK
jgi:hypothetical protein